MSDTVEGLNTIVLTQSNGVWMLEAHLKWGSNLSIDKMMFTLGKENKKTPRLSALSDGLFLLHLEANATTVLLVVDPIFSNKLGDVWALKKVIKYGARRQSASILSTAL